MKGLEKLTSIRLAEVLTQKNLVPAEAVTDALYAQDRGGEPFCESLVTTGHISEWDLARVVVEAFQIPFLLASNYDIREEARDKVDSKLLFRSSLVPVDLFDNVLTVVMPILTPFEVLHRIQKSHKVEIFPYVGLASENKKILTDLFPDYAQWAEQEEQARAKRAASGDQGGGANNDDWMNIFDSADAQVRNNLGGGKKRG